MNYRYNYAYIILSVSSSSVLHVLKAQKNRQTVVLQRDLTSLLWHSLSRLRSSVGILRKIKVITIYLPLQNLERNY